MIQEVEVCFVATNLHIDFISYKIFFHSSEQTLEIGVQKGEKIEMLLFLGIFLSFLYKMSATLF